MHNESGKQFTKNPTLANKRRITKKSVGPAQSLNGTSSVDEFRNDNVSHTRYCLYSLTCLFTERYQNYNCPPRETHTDGANSALRQPVRVHPASKARTASERRLT